MGSRSSKDCIRRESEIQLDLMRISLVVPAFNEERFLPRLIDSIDVARERYVDGSDAVEIIVADNDSTDGTALVALSRGCQVVRVTKRRIGAARNGGAALATGDVVCFVDADMRIHPETFNVIARLVASGRFVGGATGVRPERWSLGFAMTYAMLVPLVVLMRMDTGVVFCRRADFERVQGYDAEKPFAEDVDFLLRLRKLGRADRRRLVRATEAKAIASLRKFDEFGEWHYFTSMMPLAFKILIGRVTSTEFADRYWYKPGR